MFYNLVFIRGLHQLVKINRWLLLFLPFIYLTQYTILSPEKASLPVFYRWRKKYMQRDASNNFEEFSGKFTYFVASCISKYLSWLLCESLILNSINFYLSICMFQCNQVKTLKHPFYPAEQLAFVFVQKILPNEYICYLPPPAARKRWPIALQEREISQSTVFTIKTCEHTRAKT